MSERVGSERRPFIGGSDARIIMGSDEAALVRLWREKRGEAEREDLSGNLIVQLGAATEDLNRSWYERNTGRRVTDVQRRVTHSAIPWIAATLDGIVEGSEATPCQRSMHRLSSASAIFVPRVASAQGCRGPTTPPAMPTDVAEADEVERASRCYADRGRGGRKNCCRQI